MGFLDTVQDAIQTKVKIIAYSDEDGSPSKEVGSYQVKINPSSITHNKSITYSDSKPPGDGASTGNFKHTNPDKISFDIVLDGTGALGLMNIVDDVATEISKLEEVVYKYDGNIHEPRYIKILWGDLAFLGRLTSLDYAYTMFKPSGKPLRVKIKLSFESSESLASQAKNKKNSSPDLSHLVTVKAGDTLPTMCERIYRSSHYYMQVARINKLTDFRNLIPGTALIFPPIKK